jgi:hypothetical protein
MTSPTTMPAWVTAPAGVYSNMHADVRVNVAAVVPRMMARMVASVVTAIVVVASAAIMLLGVGRRCQEGQHH